MLQNLTKSRAIRGFAILAQSRQIEQKELHTFKVKSQSGNGQYVVTNGVGWDCSCPDHVYRQVECKHIIAVRFWLELKKKIEKESLFQLHDELVEATECKFCGSTNIIKRGVRRNNKGITQRYECKDCNRRFTVEDGFSKMKFNHKIITLALDLYFKGMSLRKIRNHLTQFYDIGISHQAIYDWLKKYSKLINGYMNTLEPELSRIWNVDEMKVKCGGK